MIYGTKAQTNFDYSYAEVDKILVAFKLEDSKVTSYLPNLNKPFDALEVIDREEAYQFVLTITKDTTLKDLKETR